MHRRIYVSEHARLHVGEEGNWTASDPALGAEFELADWRIAALLCSARDGILYGDAIIMLRDLGFPAELASEIVCKLVEVGCLSFSEPARSIWYRYGWDDAAFIHLWARQIDFEDRGARKSEIRRAILSQLAESQGVPEIFAKYDGRHISIAASGSLDSADLSRVLIERKTTRHFAKRPCDSAVVAEILSVSTASMRMLREGATIAAPSQPEIFLDSAFSAFELYVVATNISDVSPGLYHYDCQEECLVELKRGDFSQTVARIASGQYMVTNNAFTILVTARFHRYMWRYSHPRAYLNLFVNLGELGQLFALAVAGAGLGCCVTPAVVDSEAEQLLGVNPSDEQTLYLISCGWGHTTST
jgi:SagB-type dehydrogenase family enzyme